MLAGLTEKFQPLIMGLESSVTKITGDFEKTKHFIEDNNKTASALIRKTSDSQESYKCYVYQEIVTSKKIDQRKRKQENGLVFVEEKSVLCYVR